MNGTASGLQRREPREAVLNRAAEQVTAIAPNIALADAREHVTRAVSRPTLRSLEAFLASHPSALTSGSSDAPLAVQKLAGSLAAAGYDTVRPPRCRRCGRETLLRHLLEDGRVCDRCRHHVRTAPCGGCGKERAIFGRDQQNNPLCPSCARKVEPCGQCGLARPVQTRHADGSAICRNCYQPPRRICTRCGLIARPYAFIAQGPLCGSCCRKPRRYCGGCGQVRPIARRATGPEPDLCYRCNVRPRSACTICGASHPAQPRARQPVCLSCRETGHILEPDLIELPAKRRRRRHETAHDALRAKLGQVLSDPDYGIAAQLAPLMVVYDHAYNPAAITGWLHERRGAAGLLGDLAGRAHTEPVTHEMLDRYPQNQALHHLRDLLVHAGVLLERDELLDRITPWLENLLRQRPAHHATLVRPFATWHALRRARQRSRRRGVTTGVARHVRSQIRTALHFLAWLDVQETTLDAATQGDLDRWLDASSQYGYFLSGFLTWATARHLCSDLAVPARPRGEPHLFVTDDQRWHMLRRCLRDDDLPLEVRVTGALVLLYGKTVTRIAGLTTANLHSAEHETYLRFDEFTVLIPPSLAVLLHRQHNTRGPAPSPPHYEPAPRFLLPGTSPGRPAAAKVLCRKLRAHGIDPLPARSSARAAWARDVPAPIAADLLGVHITTATQWAGRARRDWTDYLIARAENSRPDRDARAR